MQNLRPLGVESVESYVPRFTPTIEMIRTGVEADGSCFFHSLFMAFKHFRNLSSEEKRIYIQRKRKTIAEDLTLPKWFQIQNGDVAFLQIIEMMRIMIYMIPSLIHDPNQQSTFDSYQIDLKILEILFNLLDPTQVDHTMLPNWDVECCKIEKSELNEEILLHRMKSKWHQIYQENISKAIDTLEKEMDPSDLKMTDVQRLMVIHKLADVSYFIFDFVVEKALNSFRDDLSNYSTWVNTFHFLCIMDCVDVPCNPLLIDATTGLPYEGMRYFRLDEFQQNDRPYTLLLYFPDYHFESLGQVYVKDDKTRVINRLFKKDHEIVQQYMDYFIQHPVPIIYRDKHEIENES